MPACLPATPTLLLLDTAGCAAQLVALPAGVAAGGCGVLEGTERAEQQLEQACQVMILYDGALSLLMTTTCSASACSTHQRMMVVGVAWLWMMVADCIEFAGAGEAASRRQEHDCKLGTGTLLQ